MPKKGKIKKSEAVNRIFFIEREQMLDDPLVQNWVEELIVNDQVKFIDYLTDKIFDLSLPKEKINSYYHCMKLLIVIDEDDAVDQLSSNEDLQDRLIAYIKSCDKDDICQDVLFILSSIFVVDDKMKSLFTLDFLTTLFDLLNIIEDDLNFKSAVKILIEINTLYDSIGTNLFLKVYHIHPNARVFNEVLIRLINVEEDPNKMIKMFLCLSNIFDKEQDNILYSTDLESFIDIIILKLQSAYTEELKTFIIDMMERITQYPEYYKRIYKIDEISNLFDDFANNDTETEVVKLKAKKVVDNLSQNISEMNKENIKSSKDNIDNYQDEKKNYKLVESDLKKEIIV